MGSFINSQADNEICEVLNKRFSDQVIPGGGRTYIAALRDHFQKKENFFDANHRLHRVFHRLAISVTGGPRVPKHNQSPYSVGCFCFAAEKHPTVTYLRL